MIIDITQKKFNRDYYDSFVSDAQEHLSRMCHYIDEPIRKENTFEGFIDLQAIIDETLAAGENDE